MRCLTKASTTKTTKTASPLLRFRFPPEFLIQGIAHTWRKRMLVKHLKFFFSISLSRLDFLIVHVICLGMSIPKEINTEYSLEWLLLKLKLHYFGYLMASRLTGKDSDSGKDWRQKKNGWQRMRWLANIIDWMDMNLSKFQEIVEGRGIQLATVNGITRSQTWLGD